MVSNERLIETIGRVIKAEHISFIANGAFLDAFEIDGDDVDEFLGKYCVSRGTEEDIINYFYDKCLEEFERRMNFFECLNKDAYRFLAYEIMSYLVHPSPTMFETDSLYCSFIDCMDANEDKYCYVNVDDEYFIFDFSDTDYKYMVDEKYCVKFHLDKIIDIIEKKLREYIKNKVENE